MKKIVHVVSFILCVFLLSNITLAQKFDVSIAPSQLLFYGNQALKDVYIYVRCENATLEQISGNVSGPFFTTLKFFPSGDYYYSRLEKEFLVPGRYQVSISCNGSSETKSFEVFQLNYYIYKLPEIYEGEDFDVSVVVEINGKRDFSSPIVYTQLSEDFEWYVDDERIYSGENARFDTDGFVWKIHFPGMGEGKHKITISLNLLNSSINVSADIEVKPEYEIKILAISDEWFTTDEKISMELELLERGEPVIFENDSLSLYLDGEGIPLEKISKLDNYYRVEFIAPYEDAGKHVLGIKIHYNGRTIESKKIIYYPVIVEGKIKDSQGNGIPNVVLEFTSDLGNKIRIATDGSGNYKGEILPGTYDVTLETPQFKAVFYKVKINEFNDPINFNYLPNQKVDGFLNAGLYVLEAAFNYSKISLSMWYDEGKILNESRISLFKCEDWNFVKNVCYSEWEEIPAEKDTVRNFVKATVSSLSAFLVGSRKSLIVEFSTDKDKYFLDDVVRIKGMAKDELGEKVGKAKITVKGKDVRVETLANDDGYFEIEFVAPNEEGVHTFVLKAEKENYYPFEKSFELTLEKKKEISLVVPKSVEIEPDTNSTLLVRVFNSGQADLSSVRVQLSGIPEDFYEILDSDFPLMEGLRKDVRILLKIPKEANLTRVPIRIRASSDGVSSEKVVDIIVRQVAKTSESRWKFPLPTAKIILPALPINADLLALVIFSFVSIGGSLLLRKRKRRFEKTSREIRNLLFRIKSEIERKDNYLGRKNEN